MLPYGGQQLDIKMYAIFIRLGQQNDIVDPNKQRQTTWIFLNVHKLMMHCNLWAMLNVAGQEIDCL